MRDSSKHVDGPCDPFTEGVVVNLILGAKRGYPLARLRSELDDIDPEAVEDAIQSLGRVGVVIPKRTRLHMSPALRRLDDLQMICL